MENFAVNDLSTELFDDFQNDDYSMNFSAENSQINLSTMSTSVLQNLPMDSYKNAMIDQILNQTSFNSSSFHCENQTTNFEYSENYSYSSNLENSQIINNAGNFQNSENYINSASLPTMSAPNNASMSAPISYDSQVSNLNFVDLLSSDSEPFTSQINNTWISNASNLNASNNDLSGLSSNLASNLNSQTNYVLISNVNSLNADGAVKKIASSSNDLNTINQEQFFSMLKYLDQHTISPTTPSINNCGGIDIFEDTKNLQEFSIGIAETKSDSSLTAVTVNAAVNETLSENFIKTHGSSENMNVLEFSSGDTQYLNTNCEAYQQVTYNENAPIASTNSNIAVNNIKIVPSTDLEKQKEYQIIYTSFDEQPLMYNGDMPSELKEEQSISPPDNSTKSYSQTVVCSTPNNEKIPYTFEISIPSNLFVCNDKPSSTSIAVNKILQSTDLITQNENEIPNILSDQQLVPIEINIEQSVSFPKNFAESNYQIADCLTQNNETPPFEIEIPIPSDQFVCNDKPSTSSSLAPKIVKFEENQNLISMDENHENLAEAKSVSEDHLLTKSEDNFSEIQDTDDLIEYDPMPENDYTNTSLDTSKTTGDNLQTYFSNFADDLDEDEDVQIVPTQKKQKKLLPIKRVQNIKFSTESIQKLKQSKIIQHKITPISIDQVINSASVSGIQNNLAPENLCKVNYSFNGFAEELEMSLNSKVSKLVKVSKKKIKNRNLKELESKKSPVTCKYCERSDFKTNSHLQQHIGQAHSDKKFKCRKCGKKFDEKSILRTHIDLHYGIGKRFKCDYCPKRYAQNQSKLRHTQTVHDKDSLPYKCLECPNKFPRKDHMLKHLKVHYKLR